MNENPEMSFKIDSDSIIVDSVGMKMKTSWSDVEVTESSYTLDLSKSMSLELKPSALIVPPKNLLFEVPRRGVVAALARLLANYHPFFRRAGYWQCNLEPTGMAFGIRYIDDDGNEIQPIDISVKKKDLPQ